MTPKDLVPKIPRDLAYKHVKHGVWIHKTGHYQNEVNGSTAAAVVCAWFIGYHRAWLIAAALGWPWNHRLHNDGSVLPDMAWCWHIAAIISICSNFWGGMEQYGLEVDGSSGQQCHSPANCQAAGHGPVSTHAGVTMPRARSSACKPVQSLTAFRYTTWFLVA